MNVMQVLSWMGCGVSACDGLLAWCSDLLTAYPAAWVCTVAAAGRWRRCGRSWGPRPRGCSRATSTWTLWKTRWSRSRCVLSVLSLLFFLCGRLRQR